MSDTQQVRSQGNRFGEIFRSLEADVHRLIVGQDSVVRGVLTALFSGGHVLLEGVPGIGKTALVKALGSALHLERSRIQFTPDLMPADVVGTLVLDDAGAGRSVRFQPGPIHANLVLADEINRATPKTQSALLEAMQEQQVTAGGVTRPLPQPFIVLATQNPVEQEGTYPLPEAQLDRFMFKLIVGYPREEEYDLILDRTTGRGLPTIDAVTTGEEICRMRDLVRDVPVPEAARRCAVRLVMATQPGSRHAPARVGKFVALGSSPRGAQALLLAGKVSALRDGRFAVSEADIRSSAHDALRHRMLLNFAARSEGVTPDNLVDEILETTK